VHLSLIHIASYSLITIDLLSLTIIEHYFRLIVLSNFKCNEMFVQVTARINVALHIPHRLNTY
jgi:hypothetical protein